MTVTIDGSAGVTTNSGAVYNGLQTSTVQLSTSGTSIDFASIPSWVKRVTVMFSGVSTSGTNNYIIQLGYGATPTYVTSGYLGSASTQSGTSTSFSTGFMFNPSATATDTNSGIATITNITGNAWTMTSMIGNTVNQNLRYGAGNVSTVTVLTAIRITTVGSTDTFDAGSVNIIYE